MKKMSIIKIKPIKIHFNLDSDRDKVPDWKDCKPFNKKYQHISKATKERLEQLPIYVTDESIGYRTNENEPKDVHTYHVMSKEAKQKAPVARELMLSALKHKPSVIGEIEKKKPEAVTFTSVPYTYGKADDPNKVRFIGGSHYRGEVQVNLFPFKEGKRAVRSIASTTLHELKHTEQYQEGKKQGIERTEFADPFSQEYKEDIKEKEANEFAEQKLRMYRKRKPTGEEISKTLELE